MDIPGRLRSTSLRSVVDGLAAAAVTGSLELTEPRGAVHRVHVREGAVVAVDVSAGVSGRSPYLADVLQGEFGVGRDVLSGSLERALKARRLHGEVLVSERHLTSPVLDRALGRQLALKLRALESVRDARLLFHAAVRAPRSARAGASCKGPHPGPTPASAAGPTPTSAGGPRRASAAPTVGSPWGVLEVPAGATVAEIKAAYRRLARRLHPDLHPQATDGERRRLSQRLAQVNDAYRALVA